MTIDSQYSQESFNINASNTYVITFESAGPETIYVYGVNASGVATIISNNGYTLTMGGLPPIYDGATLVINPLFYPPGTIEVLVVRDTPVTQLVDLEPYTSFPAETLEFSLDKLTLIQQEQGKGDSSGGAPSPPVDPNLYVPISGTKVGIPMTGTLEMNQGNAQNWRLGPLGNPFNFYGLTDLKQDGNQRFVITIYDDTGTAKQSVFEPNGDVLVSTLYDGSNPSNTLATIQYVQDQVGGPGGAFIPLAGTLPGAKVTGDIQFENTTLGIEANFGILEGVSSVMTLYSDDRILIATGADINLQWFLYGTDGTLQLPDLDYSLVGPLMAVNKAYVDSVAGGGGGGDFVPLAGTEPAKPITGNLTFENVTNNREFVFGMNGLPGFEEGIFLGSAGSSGDPSKVWIGCSGTVYEFNPDQFLAGEIGVTNLFATNIITDGIIANGGAQFGADVNIVNGAQLNAQGGLLTTSIVGDGLLITGGGQMDSLSLNNAPTNATQATRKDYVDGLNATNVKTTGNQTINGTKTFGSTMLANGINITGGALLGIVQPALGGATKYIKCDSGGGFFSSLSVAAADVEVSPGVMLTDLASTQGDAITVARERIESLEAERDAFIQRFEAIEARLTAGGL